jgi:hypothetical protein
MIFIACISCITNNRLIMPPRIENGGHDEPMVRRDRCVLVEGRNGATVILDPRVWDSGGVDEVAEAIRGCVLGRVGATNPYAVFGGSPPNTS